MIEPHFIYKPSQLARAIGRPHWWVLERIKEGSIKAMNTSDNPDQRRYLVKGSDALKFIEGLEVKS